MSVSSQFDRGTLEKAVINAAEYLGFSREEIAGIIDRDPLLLLNGKGIYPNSKSGELAILLVRTYRSLYMLMGGDEQNARKWMHTNNLHTGGIPAVQVQSAEGLVIVVSYLEWMCG